MMNIIFGFRLTVLMILVYLYGHQYFFLKKEEGTSLNALKIAKLEFVLSCDVKTWCLILEDHSGIMGTWFW